MRRQLRVLLLEDNPLVLETNATLIQNWSDDEVEFVVQPVTDFSKVVSLLTNGNFGNPPYDVAILDIANGDNPEDATGLTVLAEIKKNLFVEVVILSAHAGTDKVNAATKSSVLQVPKDQFDNLEAILKRAVASKALAVRDKVTGRILSQLKAQEAEYLWDFKDHHPELLLGSDADQLADNLARRLSTKLVTATEASEPYHYYIRPPISTTIQGGDLFKGAVAKAPDPTLPFCWFHDGFWVVVSASCDLENPRPNTQVILAVAKPIESDAEYVRWKSDPGNGNKRADFGKFLSNRKSKHTHVLPEWFDIPTLVVDFEQTVSVPLTTLQLSMKAGQGAGLSSVDQELLASLRKAGLTLQRQASLASPYGENLVNRYSQKYGRIGVAELNTERIIEEMSARLKA